ncbi:MAG TPA: SRPBCC family protein [Streptosporangiaceae bacterium]|jgi:Polyketide cyclase / dehydrase and lipid transport|nr:SRPBCC family protein [Streptosporangiaceae bacterium]
MADKTTSSIVIVVPRKDVMTVIADFAAYPQWATAVRSAEVLAQDSGGRASAVRFQLDAGMIKDSYVLGYDWDDDAQVRWNLTEAGSVVSEMTGGYTLADRGDSTEVTYELAVGIRIPMIGMVKRRAEKMIIDTALKGLKARAEAIGSTR